MWFKFTNALSDDLMIYTQVLIFMVSSLLLKLLRINKNYRVLGISTNYHSQMSSLISFVQIVRIPRQLSQAPA